MAANRSASHAGTSRTSNASSATASDRACSPAALHGSTRRSVTEQGLELIDGHGAFATRSRPAVRNMIGTLEAIQAIDTGTGLVEPGPLFDIYLGGDR